MRNKTLFAPFIVLFVLACGSGETASEGGALGKTPAFAFHLTSLDGRPLTLSDYAGKALIVDVWDTWCPPCRKGIPEFVELYDRYRSHGLEILGVAGGQEGIAKVREFVREYGIRYDNALVTAEFVSGFGGITGIPTTFVIDKQGNLYRKYVGYTPKEMFERDIKAILAL